MNSRYAEFDGQPQKPLRLWSAALYIRLSREDENMQKVESNSITSQREFLKEYLKQHPEIEAYDYYVDDGWSGTNFERPAFQRMLADIYAGKIDCVIVKDLSRLGRNASQTSNYIDDVFARRQIRFIAVHNYIDTIDNRMNAATHCITVGIQNVINESVAATTSVNVRGTLNVERQQGKFIGSFACYGYKKDPQNHHKLLVDEDAANVVRYIYDSFIGGKSIIGITKELNERGLPNPTRYKQLQNLNYRHSTGKNNDGLWPDSSVRRILRNEVYIGNMVQGKTTTISFKHKQCRAVPKENWYIVEGTHEPIISKETFDKAQSLFNKNIRKSPKKNDVDLFAGLVRCSDCHRIMSKKVNKHSYGVYRYYRCSTNQKMKKCACGNHTIRIDKMEKALTVTIQKMIDAAIQMSDIIEKIDNSPERKTESASLRNAYQKAKKQREKIYNMQLELYPDWKSGVIDKQEYLRLKENMAERLNQIEENIENIEKTMKELEDSNTNKNDFIIAFKKYGNIKELTRPMLVELVDEILVHEGGKIEVNFKYQDSYKQALEYIEMNKEIYENIA